MLGCLPPCQPSSKKTGPNIRIVLSKYYDSIVYFHSFSSYLYLFHSTSFFILNILFDLPHFLFYPHALPCLLPPRYPHILSRPSHTFLFLRLSSCTFSLLSHNSAVHVCAHTRRYSFTASHRSKIS